MIAKISNLQLDNLLFREDLQSHMLSSQIKSNEIIFGSCNKDLLEEIIFYGIGLGADFVEIFIENTDNSSVLAEEDFITSVSPSFGRGAGIRIFKEKKDGFVSTNDLTKHGLMRSVTQAIEMLDLSLIHISEPTRRM